MPPFLRPDGIEVLREAPRLLYRLFDRQQHFLGFRDRQELLIYCDQCAVFVLVKPSARTERVTDGGGGRHP